MIYVIVGDENMKKFIFKLNEGYTDFSFEEFDKLYLINHYKDRDKLEILVSFFNAVFEVKFGKYAPDYIIYDLIRMYNVTEEQAELAYTRSSFKRSNINIIKVLELVEFIQNKYYI